MKALRDDEEMQRKGIVIISYLLDGSYPKGGVDYEYVRRQNQNFNSIPARVVALYFLVGNYGGIWNKLVDFTTLVVSPLLRLRARAIHGTYQECLYKLMCLGIPLGALPATEEGEMKVEDHAKMLSAWKDRELL